MKRQLIAALLALNVAAVAVPSATFTVNAAEDTGIEAQAESNVEQKKKAVADAIEAAVPAASEGSYYEAQWKKVTELKEYYLGKIKTTTGRDTAEIIDNLAELEIEAIGNGADKVGAIGAVPNKDEVDSAKDAIDTASAAYSLANYTIQKQEKLESLKNDAKAAIDVATDKAKFANIKTSYETEAAKVELKSKFYSDFINNVVKPWLPDGVKSLDEYGYYTDADGAHNSRTDFDTKKSECITAIETEKNDANADEDVMKDIFEQYKKELKEIPTIAQGEEKGQLDAVKKAADEELNKYFPSNKTEASYTGNQLRAIETCKSDGVKAIWAAKAKADVEKALADAKAAIDAVKTKADVEKSVAEVIDEINKLGEIKITNYNDKYNALVAAEDSFDAVEKGTVGQDEINNKTNNALGTARTAYDTFKKQELQPELDKVNVTIGTVNRRNYKTLDIKTKLNDIEKAGKTIKTDTSIVTGVATARTNYQNKIDTTVLNAIINEVNDMFNDLNVTDSKFVINDKNRKAAELAIATYDELSELGVGNSAKTTKDNALSAKRKEYRKLKDLFAVENAAKEDLDLSKGSITAIPDQVYTGKPIEISNVEVKDRNGKVVDAANYDVSYVSHTNKGTATIKINAKGNVYTGSLTGTFNIVARDIKDAKVTVENLYYRSGKARNASPVVKVDGVDIARNRDYTVTYKNNINVGLATVEITGVGNYTGKTSGTYAIMPEKAKITSLKAGAKKFTVKVVKEKGAKYQVAYKVKGSSKYKTVTTKNVTKTVKGLKKGKTYSVKVRAYQTINGKKYLGNYSNVKNVKVK